MEKVAEDCAAARCDEFDPVSLAASALAASELASCVSQQDWLYGIVRILASRPLGLHVAQLEQLLWALHFPHAPMPARFRVRVQSILSRYTAQSAVFRQRKARLADDLFYSPEGKGSGTWAVDRSKAEAWLHRRRNSPARCLDRTS